MTKSSYHQVNPRLSWSLWRLSSPPLLAIQDSPPPPDQKLVAAIKNSLQTGALLSLSSAFPPPNATSSPKNPSDSKSRLLLPSMFHNPADSLSKGSDLTVIVQKVQKYRLLFMESCPDIILLSTIESACLVLNYVWTT